MTSENLFVVLEGTDGSGKTTIRRWLYRALRAMGMDVLAVRQNSWLDLEATRVITTARFLQWPYPLDEITAAYVRDKELLSEQVIEPHLTHRHVIADRYILSDIVYHESLFGIPHPVTHRAYAASRARMADVVVYIDTPIDVCIERLALRPQGQMRHWDVEAMQRALYARFHRVLFSGELPSMSKVLHVDNSGPLTETLAQLERELMPLFAAGEAS